MKVKKITILAISVTLAMILSYVETLIPNIIMIPGIKIGLANVIIIYIFYYYGFKEALLVNTFRIILTSMLFTTIISFLFSIFGGIISLFVIYLLNKSNKLSKITISSLCAISHNISQIIIAIIFTDTIIISYYIPVLVITGLISGLFVGFIANILINKLSIDN